MYSMGPQNINAAYPVIKETVPQSSLGYTTNNNYPKFPPLMSDGRSVTASWQPQAVVNADLLQQQNIKSNWQYRKYLTENSKQIMEYNFREASNDMGYYKREVGVVPSTNPPYQYKSVNDNSATYGRQDSDLKQMYLSREQLEANKVSPLVTQAELVKIIASGKSSS